MLALARAPAAVSAAGSAPSARVIDCRAQPSLKQIQVPGLLDAVVPPGSKPREPGKAPVSCARGAGRDLIIKNCVLSDVVLAAAGPAPRGAGRALVELENCAVTGELQTSSSVDLALTESDLSGSIVLPDGPQGLVRIDACKSALTALPGGFAYPMPPLTIQRGLSSARRSIVPARQPRLILTLEDSGLPNGLDVLNSNVDVKLLRSKAGAAVKADEGSRFNLDAIESAFAGEVSIPQGSISARGSQLNGSLRLGRLDRVSIDNTDVGGRCSVLAGSSIERLDVTNTRFHGPLNLDGAKLKGPAAFRYVTFQDLAGFNGVLFDAPARQSPAPVLLIQSSRFDGFAGFSRISGPSPGNLVLVDVEFAKAADFSGSAFRELCLISETDPRFQSRCQAWPMDNSDLGRRFPPVRFQGTARFDKVTADEGSFRDVYFGGNVSFRSARFMRALAMEDVTFATDSDWINARLPVWRKSAGPENRRGVSFDGCRFGGRLDMEWKALRPDNVSADVLAPDSEAWRDLEVAFERSGNPLAKSECSYRHEMVKMNAEHGWKRLGLEFLDTVFGFSLNVRRPLRSLAAVILGFGLAFWLLSAKLGIEREPGMAGFRTVDTPPRSRTRRLLELLAVIGRAMWFSIRTASQIHYGPERTNKPWGKALTRTEAVAAKILFVVFLFSLAEPHPVLHRLVEAFWPR